MTFNQHIGHKDDIYKYAMELLNAIWPLSEPVRTLALKLNNLRNRTDKDFNGSLIESMKENLKYFMGKGRRPNDENPEQEGTENGGGQGPPVCFNFSSGSSGT